ncbi:hypothetical protein [[Clostridium] fimetarium]|uniref:Uncharacterized protein n=1 Tax=[Clostridium] fimetarium TaxID=99656 RepID=A0A1I0QY16_9FIRM|nr:hypothetical protein [[Clostridium] fimetarium]SEW32743.1 hypothetical protein SAMN05421659_11017 [[Clostridium] fimetarium]
MIRNSINFAISNLIGAIIVMILNKKFNISKKVNDIIVFTFLVTSFAIGVVFDIMTNISIYVYIYTICYGMVTGSFMGTWLVNKRNKK